MDVITCEAPLDNSFQKDRRELVNKGSLGRRRKPSRSNLRLILSPANDRQDIDVFHGHQSSNSDASFVQVNGSNHARDSILDNQQAPVKNGSSNRFERGSYSEVVASINQISSLKPVDFNGNNNHSAVKSNNRRNTASPVDVVKSKYPGVYENNNVNAKYSTQLSIAKSLQTENHRPQSNGHSYIKSNGYHENVGSKAPRIAESANRHQILKISNQEKTVSSKNHINIITFSNHRQIITSSPVQSQKVAQINGNHSESYKESSLPRTSKEPNLVAEAQQFSIEAKLRRKKSEVQGRSAVLIQTWERRTQSESYSKLRRDSKTTAPKNRFSDKENSDANATVMPDSYICIKYKGSLQNGDKLHKGELVPSVRGVSLDENMLYRVPDERPRRAHHSSAPTNGGVTVNGNAPVQEPEWISLSKKLCAKFVEGHIEPHSPDSYPYEESEGVREVRTPSPQPKTRSGVTPQTQPTVQKKLLPAPFFDENASNSEPPWIHLSRKLCNKFIEEHIEYPPITNGHFVEVPELVEPNGDVRIIEKVGKPKSHKSKQKKESEPEWVSLSKKLRAKFIESHIDDPDTIALDNQLNASDPEETSSETLSDVSQELPVPNKGKSLHREPVECKNFTVRSKIIDHESAFQENGRQPAHDGSVIFPDKECSWEYQEMEFDQESNSGNFQEPEYCDEPLQEARVQRGSLPEDDQDQFAERLTFSQCENNGSFKIPECYNNDVKFLPYFEKNDTSPEVQQLNKLITVQFIARTASDGRNGRETEKGVPEYEKGTKSGSFFNLSTWDEAHYKEDVDDQADCQETTLNKKFLSKSLDNLCDSLEERSLMKDQSHERKVEPDSLFFGEDFTSEQQILINSKDSMNRKAGEMFTHEFNPNHESTSDISSMKENAHCTSVNTISETENDMLYANNFSYTDSKESIYRNPQNVESSSEDEVFESDNRNKKQVYNDPETHYGKISPRKSPLIEKEKQADQVQIDSEKVKHNYGNKNSKDIKCNGMIPNSIYDGFPDNRSATSKHNHSANKAQNAPKEPVKLGMSKWITMSRSEQNISKPEYSNVKPTLQKDSKNSRKSSGSENGSKGKSKKNNNQTNANCENKVSSSKNMSPKNANTRLEEEDTVDFNRREENSNKFNGYPKECDLKTKCKSLCDISLSNDDSSNGTAFKHHESVTNIYSGRRTPSQVEFQHSEYESEIPLCAKLVSNHNKNMTSRNTSSQADRPDSPSHSESSHVYEDMFKETPSGPSDSEASSWVMKNNTYYINGRSSSMNDLDYSDSCSLSVKCDYASSSENSTLQSRHSSYASSSFYVNLRDYDSHMLEPSLNKGKKTNGKLTNSESSPNISKSNPPTPESLRHLFTSPLSSIHSPPNRAPRLLNRMPSDPQSHYYSTAAATSSAFKHGFSLTPPKPKKTERSSSIKIKDIAHGIILTFKRFQNHSKSSSVRSTQQVDVSHLAEINSHSELSKAAKSQKNSKKQDCDKDNYWQENGRAEIDSGFLSDVQRAKARRSSSDLTGMKSNSELFNSDKKKNKSSKKNGSKGKKSKSKTTEPRTVPTVSRKVQQMADGTLYLVTTVSGDTSLPGVYSDSPDTSSELSTHKPVKVTGESNC